MKLKSKKSALLLSFTSLLLCFAMLVGSTFAWFTDTATTGVNKIQAGNLDVELMMLKGSSWVSAEGETLTFKTKDNRTTDEILWEPGCTYKLPALRIDNSGNLALKYKIVISGIKGDAKLNEAIEWKIADGFVTSGIFHEVRVASMEDASMEGVLYPSPMSPGYPSATNAFVISGHMKDDAGNEYQGLSIEGISITVLATQYTYESDSINNQYDKEAGYAPEPITAAELKKIFLDEDGKLKADVKLEKDYLLTDAWTPLNCWTHNGPATGTATIDGQGHTIYNMTVNGDKALGFIGMNSADLTIKNLTFSNATVVGTGSFLGVVIGYQYGDVTLENVQVVNSVVKSTAEKGIRIGGLVGYSPLHDSAKLHLKDCTVKNSNFEGYHNTCGLVGSLYDYTDHNESYSIANCTVSGCHFVWGSPTVKYNHYAFVDGGKYLLTEPDAAISGVTMTNNTCAYKP